jgi:hypothetical protein
MTNPWRRILLEKRRVPQLVIACISWKLEVREDCLTYEDGTNMLSRNQLRFYAAQHPISAKASNTPLRAPEMSKTKARCVIQKSSERIMAASPLFIMRRKCHNYNSIQVFRLQKIVIRIICGIKNRDSCKDYFKR